MFERFTEGSKAVLVQAQDLAIELGSDVIDVGHILYGCAVGREETAGGPLREAGITSGAVRQLLPHHRGPATDAIDAEALRAIGIDYDGVRSATEETFGPGALEAAPDRRSTSTSRRPPFSVEAKRSLEQALRVTLELHDKHIVPGHVLLGVLRVNDEFVSDVLKRSGASVAVLSSKVLTEVAAASS